MGTYLYIYLVRWESVFKEMAGVYVRLGEGVTCSGLYIGWFSQSVQLFSSMVFSSASWWLSGAYIYFICSMVQWVV